MSLSEAMRECLETADVHNARELWAKAAPHLPQPKDDEDALKTIHYARTVSGAIRDSLRCYSHLWLEEQGLPSGLPDRLRPNVDRLYPRNPAEAGGGVEIRKAMEYAVLEAEADGRLTDSPFVKLRVEEARAKERRKLFGR
jgi:hypothetical protein